MRRTAATIGALVALLGSVPALAQDDADGRYQQFGDPGGFLNIVPPGQDGVLNPLEAVPAQGGQYPPHVIDQLAMYGDLVYEDATPGMTEERLLEHFKDASFGVPPDDIDRVYRPGGRDDVEVIRDASFGVPHVFGDTREGVMFGAGYTGAEDRLFLMDVLRHLGRARLSEFLGPSEGNQAMDRAQLAVAPYREEDLTAQADALRNAGAEGAQIAADAEAYSAGVNQYISEAILDTRKLPSEYLALQQLPAEWVVEDIIAIASLVGGIFGKGGGGEIDNYCDLRELADTLGSAEEARTIFDDLHFRDDPEAPVTTTTAFPYMSDLGPVDPASVPDVDCASLQPIDPGSPGFEDIADALGSALPVPPFPPSPPGVAVIDGPLGGIALDLNGFGMSNALLVEGQHTTSGSPIAVFGPQTAYFVPQLLVEKDLHGPGIDARGVSFAGTDIFIQLGRGRDYAWSATSAGADNVDNWIVRLCDPEGGEPTTTSMGYLRGGDCEPIETWNHTQIAKPSAGGQGGEILLNQRIERTAHYGFLLFRGTTGDGTPIAVTNDRTTYRAELGSAFGFYRINDPTFMTDGYESFRRAMGGGVDYTFNWFYADATDIGYQHSCRCPVRAQGTDPYLPTWGTGEWDWQGFVPLEGQPHERDPERGFLANWNNKQAPGWWAHDSDFDNGPVYRNLLLIERLERELAQGKVRRSDVVDAMALAGTTDLRTQEVLPELLRLLEGEPPSGTDERVTDMRDRLRAWMEADGHRRDHDGDGAYDDPVPVAITDAWWGGMPTSEARPWITDESPLVRAIFGDAYEQLGDPVGSPLRHIGDAFNGGPESHVDKDLRQVLGDPVQGPFSRTYCGGGDRDACSDALWASLAEAAAILEEGFGSVAVSDWQRVPEDETIVHVPVGVVSVPDIHWINRPTFQQVVQLPPPPAPPGPAPGGGAPDGGQAPPAAPLPATGARTLLSLLGVALLAAALLSRRRPR